MYQLILESLKTKFPGISDAVLSRIATKLAKTATTEEQVKTSVEGVTLQQVIDSYADSRATEASDTAVKNYETKHGLKDGVKEEQPKPAEDPKPKAKTEGDEVPAWAQSLIDSNKALSEKLAAIEQEKTTSSRREQLNNVISKLPAEMQKPYGRMSLDGMDDNQFNTMITEVTAEVESLANSIKAKGAAFSAPSSQQGGKPTTELSKEQLDAISKREGSLVDGAQPF